MGPLSGIIVQIFSNGQLLDQYDDPDEDEVDDEYTRSRYIEAITGATFGVKVMLTTQFQLHGLLWDDVARVSIDVDGQPLSYDFISRMDLEESLCKGQPGEFTFDSCTDFCPRSGQWMRSDLTFGELETKEATRTKTSPGQVKNLGKIQVFIQRRGRRERGTAKAPPMAMFKPHPKEIPEKALKGTSISNAVIMTNARPSRAPPSEEYHYEFIPGSVGEKVTYKIFYRSKRALQMLGCIPRSPSPALEISDNESGGPSSKTDAAPANVREEVKELRARLALLEGTPQIKGEPRIGVKREREDDNTGTRRRSRKSAKIETIDLTDD